MIHNPHDDSSAFQPTYVERLLAFHRAGSPRKYTARQVLANPPRLTALFAAQLLIFAALVGYYIAKASVHWVAVIDDSYITFRFVDMFVHGHGWRYSPAGPRVEGFTNFLWAMALVPAHIMKLDLMVVSKILGLLCGIFTMFSAMRLTRFLRDRDDLLNLVPVAILATSAPFAHWSMMGMETLMQTALVLGAYHRFESERRDLRRWTISPILCVLAAMTRIDSLYYLAPLGLYGLWLVIFCRMPLRRMIYWAMLAAIPFTIYWTWRWQYFGDILPNTYYAKQRLVPFEGYSRGPVQLDIFYFDLAGDRSGLRTAVPVPFSQIAVDDPQKISAYIARIAWLLGGGKFSSALWMNLWMSGALLCGCAAVWGAVIGIRKFHKREDILGGDVTFGKISILILMPWAMNVFYIYHVNGDWMPSFRFFQIVIPFIAVAVAVGLDFALRSIKGTSAPAALRLAGMTAAGAAALLLILGVAIGQARVMSVYIFGADGIYWSATRNDWFKPAQIAAGYRMGFSPPLEGVSNYLLLNTQDNAWIFMSDIGQPLWFAEHLNLYDVDGLTDPYLSHAPSRRGKIPSLRNFRENIEWRNEKNNQLVPPEQVAMEAQRAEFDAFLDRNMHYIMDEKKPEYLLLFINHEKPDPKSPGGAYPEISYRVWKHPNLANYTDDWQAGKIGNAFNHVFRRNDVTKDVPEEVKLKRLYRAIDRNQYLPSLVQLLESESHTMKNLTDADRAKIRGLVIHTLKRFPNDEATRRMQSSALNSNDGDTVAAILEYSEAQKPDSMGSYFLLADAYEKGGKFDMAEQTVAKALTVTPSDDNTTYYRLIWLNEQLGRPDKIHLYAKLASERQPTDERPWSDMASSLERLSNNPKFSREESLAMKRDALAAFNKLIELMGEKPEYLNDVMAGLERDLLQAAAPVQPAEVEQQGPTKPQTDTRDTIPLPRLPEYESRYGP